ncbi:fructose-6-phosphate aldolase [Carboxylicivirga sediminis]|uniref:Fructose-6-phosphate aldolase n=1 Tax=Carboxylicivirga sediminis TaxID=2006564 RepID=A0A941F373_9BACT|nr:transaldolase family protein [Carboxylicivirga sediminis]MBR8535901.1 fructose-6-phosphate aldolase [Carboxylicivirga sediminis]
MIYLADTANIEELRKLFYYFPLEGVTTNPTIIAQAGKPMSVILPELIEIVQDKMLHVQMISNKAEDMLREAKAYKAKYGLGNNYFAKIPVSEEGYRAMPMIKEAGINVTATAIFTQQQALVAARAGADWVAPYVNRLDNISSHGIEVVGNIVENIEYFGLSTKVLAASFKTVDQVHRVSMMGSHAATVNFEILERLRSHPMTDMSIEWFEKDAKGLYDIKF